MEELQYLPEPEGPTQEQDEALAEAPTVSLPAADPMEPVEDRIPEAVAEPELGERTHLSPETAASELSAEPAPTDGPAPDVKDSPEASLATPGADDSPGLAEPADPERETETPSEAPPDAVSMDELMGAQPTALEAVPEAVPIADSLLRAVLEAIVYVAEEPLTVTQLSAALGEPSERVHWLLSQLMEEFDRPEHGLAIREVAGGFKITTKPEHHEAVRNFVKSLKPPLKLSLPALETLAVIAYKQPVTAPEIMEIRGVQGAGVLKTLLDRKLIATAGRKNVIGKPILYKTTKEFLIQFGLKDLLELPSLKEFEEIRRLAFGDEPAADPPAPAEQPENRTLPLMEPESDSPEN